MRLFTEAKWQKKKSRIRKIIFGEYSYEKEQINTTSRSLPGRKNQQIEKIERSQDTGDFPSSIGSSSQPFIKR